MIKTDELSVTDSPGEVLAIAKSMAEKYNFFLIEKNDRVILKREITYSNGTSVVVQKFTILPMPGDNSTTDITLSLEVESNFLNKTIESMYVTDTNTVKALTSFKNVLSCLIDKDMPLSPDEYNISGGEAPTSFGVKAVIYVIIAFSLGIIFFALEKGCR